MGLPITSGGTWIEAGLTCDGTVQSVADDATIVAPAGHPFPEGCQYVLARPPDPDLTDPVLAVKETANSEPVVFGIDSTNPKACVLEPSNYEGIVIPTGEPKRLTVCGADGDVVYLTFICR